MLTLLPNDPNKLLLITVSLTTLEKITILYDYDFERMGPPIERLYVPLSVFKKLFPYTMKSTIISSLNTPEIEYIEADFWNKIPKIGKSSNTKSDIIVINSEGARDIFSRNRSHGYNLFYDELISLVNGILINESLKRLAIINKEASELIKIMPFANDYDYKKKYNIIIQFTNKIIDSYRLKMLQKF